MEVLSAREIEATLDSNGTYERVPFTDEMRRFCGRRFRVFKRADKICVERPYSLDLRRMRNAVFLEEVRCDGSAHDGCKRMCMVFWKEAWLKPAPRDAEPEPPVDWVGEWMKSTEDYGPIDETKTYACQATALHAATEPLKMWDPRHYVRDLLTGSVKPWQLPKVLFTAAYNKVARSAGRRDWGMVVGESQRTPQITIGLEAGDRVRVKSKEEIQATLDARGKNRGLSFGDTETARHCGRSLRVLTRIDRMILEDTGKMRGISNTVLLQGAQCSGLCFRGCARNGHPMWREAWLEKETEPGDLVSTIREKRVTAAAARSGADRGASETPARGSSTSPSRSRERRG